MKDSMDLFLRTFFHFWVPKSLNVFDRYYFYLIQGQLKIISANWEAQVVLQNAQNL